VAEDYDTILTVPGRDGVASLRERLAALTSDERRLLREALSQSEIA
jgi:hypothetical protein